KMRGLFSGLCQILVLNDIGRCRSFGAVDDLEGDPRAFSQGFETLGLNCRMMYEYILAAILFNKTKTF
ncbi:MAG: hypothetical protein ACD_75C01809G0001, partial [uncultured bacterium]